MGNSGTIMVRGLGLRLTDASTTEALIRQISGTKPATPAISRFTASGTELAPVEQLTLGPVEPRMPASVAARGLRNLPHESLLALAAAAEAQNTEVQNAERPQPPGDHTLAGGHTAVLWASSTTGLPEYGAICVAVATLDPGLASPMQGPMSSYNGPAAVTSIRLGLTGPSYTFTGGVTAGLTALVEAVRILEDGDAAAAMVGASSALSRWSLIDRPDGLVPAEGAACLSLGRTTRSGAVGFGSYWRVCLQPATLPRQASRLIVDISSNHRADAVVIATPTEDVLKAVTTHVRCPVWHVERRLGDFGAAGGLLAAVSAVAYCSAARHPTTVLAAAVEPGGAAIILEVISQ
jgi:hypothetical protein